MCPPVRQQLMTHPLANTVVDRKITLPVLQTSHGCILGLGMHKQKFSE